MGRAPQRRRQQQQARPRVVVVVGMKMTIMRTTILCLSIIMMMARIAHTTTAFTTTRPEPCGSLRRGMKRDGLHHVSTIHLGTILQPAAAPPAVSFSALHAVSPPPPAVAEAAAQVITDKVPAVYDPTLVSVLIPVAIAAVVYTLLFPDTSDNIREFWEDQFEKANEGPLIIDYEPVELKAKYLSTPSATNGTENETVKDYVVSQKEDKELEVTQDETSLEKEDLASDKIRDFWEHEVVEKANKAPESQSITTKNKPEAVRIEPDIEAGTTTTSVSTSIPVIPKEASAEELTSLLSSVAESITNGKDLDALIAERKRVAEFEEPLSDKIKQVRPLSKRRILQRAAKKAVMPWRKWDSL